jgi:hypothetical protein
MMDLVAVTESVETRRQLTMLLEDKGLLVQDFTGTAHGDSTTGRAVEDRTCCRRLQKGTICRPLDLVPPWATSSAATRLLSNPPLSKRWCPLTSR